MANLLNFANLNPLNVFTNVISGNMLPMTNKNAKVKNIFKLYSIFVWIIEVVFITTCALGVFNVPVQKALEDSTVTIVVSIEIILLISHLHNRKNLLRGLIEKLDSVLTVDNETLRNAVINTVKPLQKTLKIYTIGAIASVVMWTSMPLINTFRKNEFYYADYRIPAVLTDQPFSRRIFGAGVIFEIIGAAYMITKKISLDVYTIHLILMVTAQYRYLRIKIADILRKGDENMSHECFKHCENKCVICEKINGRSQKSIKVELQLLLRHHTVVVEMAGMLRELLSPNVSLLYVDSVFRLCFLGLMFAVNPSLGLNTCLIIMYTCGALTQLFILCHCIQQLFESCLIANDIYQVIKYETSDLRLKVWFIICWPKSNIIKSVFHRMLEIKYFSLQKILHTKEIMIEVKCGRHWSVQLTDDAFHEKWYMYGTSLKHVFIMMTMANKLECRLSRFRSIDLTLPSFMTILNQAYSVCLLFLRAR